MDELTKDRMDGYRVSKEAKARDKEYFKVSRILKWVDEETADKLRDLDGFEDMTDQDIQDVLDEWEAKSE